MTVTPWGGLADGVYAIDNDCNPVEYATASTAENGINKGVAFVIKGKAYQVAKVEATGFEGASTVYWDKNNSTDLALTNYTKVDGTNSYGYLAGTITPELS